MRLIDADAVADALEIFNEVKGVCDRCHAEDWDDGEMANAFWLITDSVMRWEADHE